MRSPRALAVGVAIALSLLGAPRVSRADVSATDRAAAEVLFRDAKALLDANKVDEACPKLAESQRLEPKPGTMLNLAMCHERRGKAATSWSDYMEAASLAAKSNQSDREAYARERVAALEPTLARVVIEVDQPAADMAVKLDGEVLRQPVWGTAIPIDAGEHT